MNTGFLINQDNVLPKQITRECLEVYRQYNNLLLILNNQLAESIITRSNMQLI